MNLLFWLLLVVLSAAFTVHARWNQRRFGLPSSIQDSLDMNHHPDWPLAPDSWSITALDFLATPDRIRAAVRIQTDETDTTRRRRAMKMLANRIYRQLEVHAIFVETTTGAQSTDRYLFAADGRGWQGDKFISTAFSSS